MKKQYRRLDLKYHKPLDRFRVRPIEARRYLWVEVVIYRSWKHFQERFGHRRKVAALFRHAAVVNGKIGQIVLWPGPNLEQYAVHEAIHAAYAAARYGARFGEEADREEYIATCADTIYAGMREHFEAKNWYKA